MAAWRAGWVSCDLLHAIMLSQLATAGVGVRAPRAASAHEGQGTPLDTLETLFHALSAQLRAPLVQQWGLRGWQGSWVPVGHSADLLAAAGFGF